MRNRLKKIDYPLFFSMIILTIFGLVMIFSASNVSAVLQYGRTEFYFFQRQLFFAILGFIVFFIVINIPTKNYNVLSKLAIIAIILIMIALKTYGTVTNGATSWFRLSSFSVQPSEFAKSIIILFLACSYGNKKKFNNIYDLLAPLLPCFIIFIFVALEPDLGTAGIIAIICMFIFFALPVEKTKSIYILRIVAFLAAIVAVFTLQFYPEYLSDTQASRLNFKNPCERYLEETGYQVCNGYIAIHNGGILGAGLGKSTQKYLYLPEAHTDFIFPIIVEELGLVGGGIVLLMYGFVLLRILIIARNSSSLRGSIIAFGTFALIVTHIAVNMCGMLALIPLTGVPLPFLSYGGSFILNLMFLLGLTQRVAIETKETNYKRELKKVVG